METKTDSIMRGDGPWWGGERGHRGVGSLCKSQFSNLRTDSWYAGGGDIWQLQTSFTTFNKFSNNRKYFSCLINKSGQIVLNWQSEEIVNHYLLSTTLGWQLLSWGVKCYNCWNVYILCSAPFSGCWCFLAEARIISNIWSGHSPRPQSTHTQHIISYCQHLMRTNRPEISWHPGEAHL